MRGAVIDGVGGLDTRVRCDGSWCAFEVVDGDRDSELSITAFKTAEHGVGPGTVCSVDEA